MWGIKFRFGVLVCLSLMFLETYFGVKIWDAPVVICSQSVQVKLPDIGLGNLRGLDSSVKTAHLTSRIVENSLLQV